MSGVRRTGQGRVQARSCCVIWEYGGLGSASDIVMPALQTGVARMAPFYHGVLTLHERGS